MMKNKSKQALDFTTKRKEKKLIIVKEWFTMKKITGIK